MQPAERDFGYMTEAM
jgi:hypothetical protein